MTCHLDQTTWENSPDDKILESDVIIEKNYLLEEIKELNNLGVIQDNTYISDFDLLVEEVKNN